MSFYSFFNFLFGKYIHGSEKSDLIIGTFGKDDLNGQGGDDLIFGLFGDDKISGGEGEDHLFGGAGADVIVGNRGDDKMIGGQGNDQLVWNNGDGSDFMNGGKGHDSVQVNFDTDLVNDDLQNDDVAQFSTGANGVEFARIEVNDQTERGLFQLDIRETETLETNFGGGDDTAVLKGDVLEQIRLDLDGGDGIDTLDLGQATSAVDVNLATGRITEVVEPGTLPAGTPQSATAENFENITGTAFDDVIVGDSQDNVIRGGAGNDTMSGGEGADTFVFFEEDTGVDIILDFEFGVDRLEFRSSDTQSAMADLMNNVEQVGDDLQFLVNNKTFIIEDTLMSSFNAEDFFIM